MPTSNTKTTNASELSDIEFADWLESLCMFPPFSFIKQEKLDDYCVSVLTKCAQRIRGQSKTIDQLEDANAATHD